MSQTPYFSCKECIHGRMALDSELFMGCRHPSVISQKFSAQTYSSLSAEDWLKIDELINKILKLKLNLVNNRATNFSFPFRFNPIWIVGCAGFERE